MVEVKKDSISVVLLAFNESLCQVELSVSSLLKCGQLVSQIIVVVDGSNRSSELGTGLRGLFGDQLEVVTLKQNVGPYRARVIGLKKVERNWVSFLDAGDCVNPEQLEILFSKTLATKSDVGIGSVRAISDMGNKLFMHINMPERKYETDILYSFLVERFGDAVVWNKIYNRRLFKNNELKQMHERLDVGEDFLMNLVIFKNANRVYVSPAVTHFYRLNPNSLTRTISKKQKKIDQILLGWNVGFGLVRHQCKCVRYQLDFHFCAALHRLGITNINLFNNINDSEKKYGRQFCCHAVKCLRIGKAKGWYFRRPITYLRISIRRRLNLILTRVF